MRLAEVERGDSLRHRAMITMISTISGIRLPDAARVAFYHKDFVGRSLGAWTQQAMRGPSSWSIGERELMAAMVAVWNANTFCRGAHRAVAVHGIDAAVVDACLADYPTAPIPQRLRATLAFLETMTREPERLDATHARRALDAGVSVDDLADAAAVAAVFNVITRYAEVLDFTIPTDDEYAKAAEMMLKRGYG